MKYETSSICSTYMVGSKRVWAITTRNYKIKITYSKVLCLVRKKDTLKQEVLAIEGKNREINMAAKSHKSFGNFIYQWSKHSFYGNMKCLCFKIYSKQVLMITISSVCLLMKKNLQGTMGIKHNSFNMNVFCKGIPWFIERNWHFIWFKYGIWHVFPLHILKMGRMPT